MHIVYLALLVVDHQNDTLDWMFSEKVPIAVYITTNVMPIVISSFLYAGIFRVGKFILKTRIILFL